MTSPRDRFIADQAVILGEYFELAPGEEEARHLFEQLAIDTYDAIAGRSQGLNPFRPWGATFNPIARETRGLSPELRRRWNAWEHEYRLLRERQPLLQLEDMLSDIGESHSFCSWPLAMEWDILDWVDSGDLYALPFDDRNDIVTASFYRRLRELRQRVGGWLYWDEPKKRVVFATDGKIPQIRGSLRRREMP